jgi:hypothetical protein
VLEKFGHDESLQKRSEESAAPNTSNQALNVQPEELAGKSRVAQVRFGRLDDARAQIAGPGREPQH